jgi:uncharacterized protein YjbI with pentapeptide repeats
MGCCENVGYLSSCRGSKPEGKMTEAAAVDWDKCGVEGCIGIRPQGTNGCLIHDKQHLDAALQRLSEEGYIDARGVTIDAQLWDEFLTNVRRQDDRPSFQDALFGRAVFTASVDFVRATFERRPGFGGAIFLGKAEFGGVIFKGGAWFGGATFEEKARFENTMFGGEAGFSWTIFKDEAWFSAATFEGGARFGKATFRETAGFGEATFRGVAWFRGATFEGKAGFDETEFVGEAGFGEVTFKDEVWFNAAAFDDIAWFGGVVFEAVVWFHGAMFKHEVWFRQASFEQARQFGPMLGLRRLVLDGATFKQPVQIDVVVPTLSCRRAQFEGGVHFRLRWAEVILDDADFAEPSIVTGAPPFVGVAAAELATPYGLTGAPRFVGFDERRLLGGWLNEPLGPPRPEGQPWVASMCRANVARLSIANADLQASRFAGAHNLDGLRLESSKAFTAAPGLKAVGTGWMWPPIWWWSRRQTLAEEHAWRADRERGTRRAGWHTGSTWPAKSSVWVPNPPEPRSSRRDAITAPGDHGSSPVHERMVHAWQTSTARIRKGRGDRRVARGEQRERAREVANLYRALRKGREDAKDEPGAADFYYGEMEMRRYAAPRFGVERIVLTLYWLLAGYALRAWRALTAIIVVLVFAAWLLINLPGFADPEAWTFWSALRYSGRTAIGLLPRDQPELTPVGDVIQITVRVVVPVLLGLTVLSIRGRVKR